MILKDKYKREYEPKYEYTNGWIPYISTVDKFRFGIKNEEKGFNYSVADSKSFETAEEAVFENYKKIVNCNHNWKRWLPHANTGICEYCNIMKHEMYASLKKCEHENCDESGEKTLTTDSSSKNYCMKHYMIQAVNNANNLKKKENIESEDRILETMKVIEADMIELLSKNEKFMLLDEKKQRKLLENMKNNINWVFSLFVDELNNKEPIQLGVFWDFQYSIRLKDLNVIALKWFQYSTEQPVEDKEIPEANEIFIEIFNEVKKEIKELDLISYKETLEKSKRKSL